MVLNRLRQKLEPLLTSIGVAFSRIGLSPNAWTAMGFLFSLIAGILFAVRPSQTYLAGIAILVAGFLDIIDGLVARITHKVSKLGSFNDSTLDRVAEVSIYSGIAIGSYSSPILPILAVSFSLLVSYARAKGDSLGISLKGVGIGERAERLIVIVIFSIVGFVWIGLVVVILLAIVTFIQRYVYIAAHLRTEDKLGP